MEFKTIAYIIVDLLFICVIVAAFICAHKQKDNKEVTKDGDKGGAN